MWYGELFYEGDKYGGDEECLVISVNVEVEWYCLWLWRCCGFWYREVCFEIVWIYLVSVEEKYSL